MSKTKALKIWEAAYEESRQTYDVPASIAHANTVLKRETGISIVVHLVDVESVQPSGLIETVPRTAARGNRDLDIQAAIMNVLSKTYARNKWK